MGEVDIKDSQKLASQAILDAVRKKKDILIISNETVDGIISGTILLQSIFDHMGNAYARCINPNVLLNSNGVEEVLDERHHYYIFLDFESKVLNSLRPLVVDNNCLFINSEKIVEVKNGFIEKNNASPSKTNTNDNDFTDQFTVTTSKFVYDIVSKFD